MVCFCGMNQKADEAGFVAVDPQGTCTGVFRVFNAGGSTGRWARRCRTTWPWCECCWRIWEPWSASIHCDLRHGHVCGSDHAHRLPVDLSDRIAAIVPWPGPCSAICRGRERPAPVIHFHGTLDRVVPLDGLPPKPRIRSGCNRWRDDPVLGRVNGCRPTPCVAGETDVADDGHTSRRSPIRRQREKSVILRIEGGGHTWPGQTPPRRSSANRLRTFRPTT